MEEMKLNGMMELSEKEMMMVDGGKWTFGFSKGFNIPSPIPSVTYKDSKHYTISINVGIGTINISTDNGGRSDYYDKINKNSKKGVIWP